MNAHGMNDEEREAVAILGGGCFTISFVLLLLAVVLLLSACRSQRDIVHDVTHVEIHDSIHYVHDTLYFDVPAQSAEVVTRDSVSQLENDYAVSIVSLNKDGTLSHQLTTKPQSVPVPFEKPVETKTQTIYKDREVKIPVPVEKELSAWQKFRLQSFWVLVAVALAALGFIFRKPLYALVRRFI